MTVDGLLDVLLASKSVDEAAEKTGKTPLAVRKIMRAKPFKNITQSVRDTALNHAVSKLNAYSPVCVDALVGMATDPDEKGSVRVAAARSVLTIVTKLTEISDILDRIDQLEEGGA
jgi:hypothetical protein